MTETEKKTSNFIRDAIDEDLKSNKVSCVSTRFPPEPNGYLHIGHAKAICLNYSIACDYQGKFSLRFDDTNPSKEEKEYVDSIIEDVKWLGVDFGKLPFFASDYFQKMHDRAIELIKKDKAYVCDLTADEIRSSRGTLTQAGVNSPNRNRSVEENLELYKRMRKGEFPDAAKTLRAKIDMSHPNLNMRDPVMYRIVHALHHRQGNKWCIYPMYDWAHGLEDSIEGITYSICTLEFENHRLLYDWFLQELGIHHPRQIEFARLNLSHTVLSKRKLLELVEGKFVSGWDDPRMPTLSGLRRRGYTPSSIRSFCQEIGVNKYNSIIDIVVLENCLRNELNKTALRVMAVLNPLKVIITNYPQDKSEELEAINNPEDPLRETRKILFSREIYIERDDFKEEPPKKFFRLSPGKEVRLRYAYFITCQEIIKDSKGEIVELRCTYDPQTRGGNALDGRKVKGTIHWVCAKSCIEAKVRLCDNLFTVRNPSSVEDGVDYKINLNSESQKVISDCKLELGLKQASLDKRYQFERLGYFCLDSKEVGAQEFVFNRIVTLKDTWAKAQKKTGG